MGIFGKPQQTLRWALLLILLVSNLGIQPASTSQAAALDVCIPGRGWNWTHGPAYPEIAARARSALSAADIAAQVRASAFGEADSCGNFQLYSTDFTVDLSGQAGLSAASQAALADRVLPVLARFALRQVGNVRLNYGGGGTKVFQGPFSDTSLPKPAPLPSGTQAVFPLKVFLLVFDPLMSNGQDLNTYMGWNPYPALLQDTITTLNSLSSARLNYSVVQTEVVSDHWPVGVDGYQYTEEEYLEAYNTQTPHEPGQADYDVIVGNPEYDLCGKVNRGEIDELWIMNAPYMGFAESRLAGPEGYWFNSEPLENPHGCTKLLPMMGISYERGLGEAIEDFGHRQEAIMTRVYGGWRADSILTNWERFSLVKAKAPSFTYSGCGGVHYAPNSLADYDYGNHTPVLSNCEDFIHYPSLGDPIHVAQPVECVRWGCTHVGYLSYWFGHMPGIAGCNIDGTINDWWQYFVHVDLAKTPFLSCPPPPCPQITGWKGEYWNNTSLLGSPMLCRNDPALGFNWGTGSPDPLVPIEYFSARWTRTVDFPAGPYIFSLGHDDGARLFIDDTLALDAWGSSCQVNGVQVTLAAGAHDLRVEMFENFGGAGINLWWEPETILNWRAEFYNNESLSGWPVLVRDDPVIDFDWANGAPDPLVPEDHFSVRWSQVLYFDEGRYLFDLFRDDGIRLKIDGGTVIEAWQPGRGQVTAAVPLSEGLHSIEVEAYDAGGTAAARFGYVPLIDIFLPMVGR